MTRAYVCMEILEYPTPIPGGQRRGLIILLFNSAGFLVNGNHVGRFPLMRYDALVKQSLEEKRIPIGANSDANSFRNVMLEAGLVPKYYMAQGQPIVCGLHSQ